MNLTPVSMAPGEVSGKGRRILPWLWLSLILVAAFFLRWQTFWIPHWQGDQRDYLTLAMKWDVQGFDGYNLKNMSMRFISRKDKPDWELAYPRFLPDDKGDLLASYSRSGLSYYDEPLYYKAPLFPVLLNLSHRLFTRGNHPFLVVKSNLGERAMDLKPYFFFAAQFWAVIVPLAASLATLIVVFLFGRHLFGVRAGIYAAAILAIQPIDILISNRLLTENLLTLFVALSFFLFFKGYHEKRLGMVACSGIAAGLAILTKQNLVLMIASVWFYSFLTAPRKDGGLKSFVASAFNRPFVIFFLGCALVSARWFYAVYEVFGNPFHTPEGGAVFQNDPTGWHSVVLAQRPHPAVLFSLGLVLLCPLFGFALASLGKGVRQAVETIRAKAEKTQILYLWIWMIPLAAYLMFFRTDFKEHRYMMPLYPALAMLAAHAMDYTRAYLAKWTRHVWAAEFVIGGLFVLCAFWQIPPAHQSVFKEQMLILHPF